MASHSENFCDSSTGFLLKSFRSFFFLVGASDFFQVFEELEELRSKIDGARKGGRRGLRKPEWSDLALMTAESR